MYIQRRLAQKLREVIEKFPVIMLQGPRQSGKTTLLQKEFPEYSYYNLERPDLRTLIKTDPLGFLKNSGKKVMLDEIQNIPELLSYIQVLVDQENLPGRFILTGSQNLLVNKYVSQTLAGRVFIATLLPLEYNELRPSLQLEEIIWNGFYPRLHKAGISPVDFYPSYIQTYIERDIRSLRALEDVDAFSRFLGLCAGRVGQLLNISSLATDAGISVNTAKAWLSLLQASYIVFLLQPWHQNFNKRLIKSPKLYFYDVGLVCSLLRIQAHEQLFFHPSKGALFENLIIAEIVKHQFHSGVKPSVYFWRESNGIEIDLILDQGAGGVVAIEIKSGQTFQSDFLRNLQKFPSNEAARKVVYGGDEDFQVTGIPVLGWKSALNDIPHLLADS